MSAREVGAYSQQGRGIGLCADPGQGFSHGGACGGELREGDELWLAGLAPAASGLGLRGWKQDEHLIEGRRAAHGPCIQVLARVTFMSMRWANLKRDRREESAECADLCGMAHVFDAVLAGPKVPGDFSPEVIAQAQAVTGNAALPARDETAAPAPTVVSLGARGLDKELHTQRGGRGHRVCYAGGVPTFVRPGGELGIEPEATTTPASMVVCPR
jgi:hypothetical protein